MAQNLKCMGLSDHTMLKTKAERLIIVCLNFFALWHRASPNQDAYPTTTPWFFLPVSHLNCLMSFLLHTSCWMPGIPGSCLKTVVFLILVTKLQYHWTGKNALHGLIRDTCRATALCIYIFLLRSSLVCRFPAQESLRKRVWISSAWQEGEQREHATRANGSMEACCEMV